MNNKTVLLAEDNIDDEYFTCQGLNASNVPLTVHVAHDGAEALDMLFTERGPMLNPDLILLDINMPKLNGLEVLARLRREVLTRFTPVVMLTSSTQSEDIARAYQAGANSYLSKPINTSHMLTLVGEMARYWLRDNRPPSKL